MSSKVRFSEFIKEEDIEYEVMGRFLSIYNNDVLDVEGYCFMILKYFREV